MGSTVLAVLAFGVGALMVVATVLSAIMTLVVPRALPVMITRWVFAGRRALFRLRRPRARSFGWCCWPCWSAAPRRPRPPC